MSGVLKKFTSNQIHTNLLLFCETECTAMATAGARFRRDTSTSFCLVIENRKFFIRPILAPSTTPPSRETLKIFLPFLIFVLFLRCLEFKKYICMEMCTIFCAFLFCFVFLCFFSSLLTERRVPRSLRTSQ